jgi:hypothetical protein
VTPRLETRRATRRTGTPRVPPTLPERTPPEGRHQTTTDRPSRVPAQRTAARTYRAACSDLTAALAARRIRRIRTPVGSLTFARPMHQRPFPTSITNANAPPRADRLSLSAHGSARVKGDSGIGLSSRQRRRDYGCSTAAVLRLLGFRPGRPLPLHNRPLHRRVRVHCRARPARARRVMCSFRMARDRRPGALLPKIPRCQRLLRTAERPSTKPTASRGIRSTRPRRWPRCSSGRSSRRRPPHLRRRRWPRLLRALSRPNIPRRSRHSRPGRHSKKKRTSATPRVQTRAIPEPRGPRPLAGVSVRKITRGGGANLGQCDLRDSERHGVPRWYRGRGELAQREYGASGQ